MTISSVGNAGSDAQATSHASTAASNQFMEIIGEQMEVSISKTFEMSCAHQLPNHDGKCANLHGHNYRIEVTLTGLVQCAIGSEMGMIKDFGRIKDDAQVFLQYDHKNLNNYYNNPTAEYLAIVWLTALGAIDSRYKSITVWETDDCCATATFNT